MNTEEEYLVSFNFYTIQIVVKKIIYHKLSTKQASKHVKLKRVH